MSYLYLSRQSNTVVTHLDLSDNGLGMEGCLAITAMMRENCYITHMVGGAVGGVAAG